MTTRFHLIAVLTLVGLGAFAVGPARATVLIPDKDGNWANAANIPDNYGDNVTAASMPVPGSSSGETYNYLEGQGWTPNVTTTYEVLDGATVKDVSYYGSGFGVNPVFFPQGDTFEITFTPESGYNVVLHEFTATNWASGTYSADFYVYDGTTQLWSDVSATIAGTKTFTSTDFGGSALASSSGQDLRLLIENITKGYQGFADVSFSQVAVPEPASLSLAAFGSLLLMYRPRRRSLVAEM